MAGTLEGIITWDMERNDEGHREYHISHKVRCDPGDGPDTILETPGLPTLDSVWDFGGDYNPWAFCTSKTKVRLYQHKEGEDGKWPYYRVDNTFSTDRKSKRCQDEQIEDPLLEPYRISGSFVHFQQEASKDRYGNPIVYTSHEPIRGAATEFDNSRPAIRIGINYLTLDLDMICRMMDTVNASTLWGLPARCIKLSDAPWERKVYGRCCYYYSVDYDFQINAVLNDAGTALISGFDRDVADSSLKALCGHLDPATGVWVPELINGLVPDVNNPTHFKQYKDLSGENSRVFIGEDGKPITNMADIHFIHIEKYKESDFLLLDIPTSF